MSLIHYTEKHNYTIYYLPLQYRELLIEWYKKVDISTFTSTLSTSTNFIWSTYVCSRLRGNVNILDARSILFA